MGMSDTTGFILYCVIYGLVWVLPMVGYGVHRYGCSVGKSDLWDTHFKPYAKLTITGDFAKNSSPQMQNMRRLVMQ